MEPNILNDLVTVFIAVVGGSGGLYGVQQVKKYVRNGHGKEPERWSKEAHDEICGLKFKPVSTEIGYLRDQMASLHDKIDKLMER